ncbi:MAG: hypothetical protein COA58_06020 [Bacteroidetes bacterium]|nr:MAG: hypothetical protein COA58_06020 [Bacteroidota bacterium]
MERLFKRILLAFDNSQASLVSLQKACDFATKFESEITALFVSSSGSDFSDSKKFLEDFTSSKSIVLHIVEKKGRVYDEVIKLQKKGDFSLTLLGLHGISGWKPFTVGSSAFNVISSATCPVISVQEDTEYVSLENILLPLADSESTRDKVPYCARLAEAFGSTVHVLGVSKNDSTETRSHVGSYIRQTERYLTERGIKYTVKSNFGVNVPERLIQYGEEVKAGLMLIMTETESAGIFIDSYSKQLVNQSTIPVMSVHVRDTRLEGASGY